ncbi:MAG: HAD hydrolase family protein, partial [Actinomycetota bacterium]
MIKLIALDLDGTLIAPDQTISKKNREALEKLASATGKKFVKYWLHGAFLVVEKSSDGEEKRMGKSEGNFLRVHTLIDNGYDPLAYRYLCFSAHYRTKLKFN